MAASVSSPEHAPVHEGRALRRARQRRHLTLEEAADSTRISKRFLEALEREAPIDVFPAPFFGRAFLREYARYLGVDPERLLQAFDARHGEPDDGLPLAAVPVPIRSRRWPARLFMALPVAALIAMAFAAARSSPLPRPLITAGPLQGHAGPGAAPVANLSSRGGPPDGNRGGGSPPVANHHVRIHVLIRATAPCWVDVLADGKQAAPPRTLQPGERLRISGKKTVDIQLGNAGGVRLFVNGKAITAGGSGQVVNLSFAKRHGRVVAV